MASNNRTPESILNAPVLTPVSISEQPGQTRAGRRHVLLDAMGHSVDTKASYTIPKAARQPASNTHYEDQVKSWHVRGKKAARHALRFA